MVLHFPRVSGNQTKVESRSLFPLVIVKNKHFFWFAGCFWKWKKDNDDLHACFMNLQLSLIIYTHVQNIMIYLKGFQYLFKLYLNLFASKFDRRNGYGNKSKCIGDQGSSVINLPAQAIYARIRIYN